MATDEFITAYGVLVHYQGYSKNIVVPDGVRKIAPKTFASCKNIERVEIPEGVVVIGGGAFAGCNNLKSVSIPDGIEVIGPHAFGCCEKIETICLPASLKKLNKNSFHLCNNLTIYVPKGSYAESCAKIMNIPYDII